MGNYVAVISHQQGFTLNSFEPKLRINYWAGNGMLPKL